MTRLRTHNNRRGARELKQGGLYTLRHGYRGAPRWGESDEPIGLPSWYEAMQQPCYFEELDR